MSVLISTLKASKSGFYSLVRAVAAQKYTKSFTKAMQMSLKEFKRYQMIQLENMIRHCVKNVPYYIKRKDLYMKGDQVVPLSEMPVLTKQQLRKDTKVFFAEKGVGFSIHRLTSGTSGTPLVLKSSLKAGLMVNSAMARFRNQYGVKRLQRSACLTGFFKPSTMESGPISWRDYLGGQLFLSIYQISDKRIKEYLSVLESYKPVELFGYASSLYLLAQAFERNNITPPRSFKMILTTSEVMYPSWRDCIERVFQAPVADQYGSQEMQCLVTQCPKGIMHINPEIGIIEVVDEYFKTVPDGNEGQILLTGIANDAMPLIRYQIGDRSKLADPEIKCECGLRWPSMEPISGRSEDAIVTPDGRKLMYLNFHCTKQIKGLVESQFIQDKQDHLKVLLVVDKNYNKTSEHELRESIIGRSQYEFKIDFEYIDKIPRGSRGKFKAVLNLLEKSI